MAITSRRLTSCFVLAMLLTFHWSSALAKETAEKNFYALPQLKKISIQKDTVYQTKGYVVMRYECPPCPKDATCATCPPPYIVISTEKKTIQYPDQMGADDLPVVLLNIPDIELGKKYRFKLKSSYMSLFFKDEPNLEVVAAEIEK